MKEKLKCKKNKGFTLAELLIAIFILSLGILGTIMFFIEAKTSTEYAQDLTVASTHAESVLEAMRTQSTLANITGTNWSTWAQTAGLNTLPSESYSVTYPSGTGADPLDIQVTVTWIRNGRTSNINLATKMTL